MIPQRIEAMFFENNEDLIIPAQDVAVLRVEHQVQHAMLILSTSFTKLPVLDDEDHVRGALTMRTIIKHAMTNTGYNLDAIADMKVGDILEEDVGIVPDDVDMEVLLRKLQDSNFVCVVDSDAKFVGIITRKEVMARINRIFHTMDVRFELKDRDQQSFVAGYVNFFEKNRALRSAGV